MENMLDFNIDSLLKASSSKNNALSDIYRPNLNKENLGSYTSILKFIPWHKNPNNSIIDKWVVFMNNPMTNELKTFDCPTTIDAPSVFQTAFFACRESERASIKDLQSNFKRNRQFFSLVQIIEDKQHPELEGQIKIFQYTTQVYDKIALILKPTSAHKKSHNPFDVFGGRLFELSIRLKQDGKMKYPDYTQSEFLDKPFGVLVDGKELNNEKHLPKIIDYLKEQNLDLDSHAYKPLTVDNKLFIAQTIESLLPSGCIELRKIMTKHADIFSVSESNDEERPKKKSAPVKTTATKPVVDEDDDDDAPWEDDDTPSKVKAKSKKVEVNEPKQSKKIEDVDLDDDDDEILDDDDFSDFDL